VQTLFEDAEGRRNIGDRDRFLGSLNNGALRQAQQAREAEDFSPELDGVQGSSCALYVYCGGG